MAVPKKRTSRAKKGMRRSQIKARLMPLKKDPETGQMVPAHTANPITGKYKGRTVAALEKKILRRARKIRSAAK